MAGVFLLRKLKIATPSSFKNMAFSTQILCPNGRRQNVVSNLNSTLLQVLEDVCKKQGFMPPEDYCFMHGRKQPDLTVSLRYLGLPNNAKLELVKAPQSRKESEVLIALQLEDGTRLQKSFNPQVVLWEILDIWQKESDSSLQEALSTTVDSSCQPPKHPVCIYMREEVIGEYALKRTPLRKLGLTSGKAVIRFLHREVDDITYAGIVEQLDIEANKKRKLEEIAARREQEGRIQSPTSNSNQATTSLSNIPESSPLPKATQNRKPEESMDVEMSSCGTSSNESMEVVQSSGARPKTVRQTTDHEEGMGGFSHFREQFVESTQSPERRPRRQRPLQSPSQMQFNQYLQSSAIEMNFGEPVEEFKFPEETKGQHLYHNEFSDVNHEDFMPCERNVKVFNAMTDKPSSLTFEEPSDEFFELTKADLMCMMSDLRKKLRDVEEQPLITKSLRESMKNERYCKYEQVVIRVQFPNYLVLQGFFKPKETVFSLYKFVKENLEDKNMDFYIYVTPPKKVLNDMSENLIQADLVPASIVYFGCQSEKAHYLKKDLTSSLVSWEEAEKYFRETVHLKNSNPEKKATSAELPPPAKPPQSSASLSTGAQAKQKGIPKWLKLSKK